MQDINLDFFEEMIQDFIDLIIEWIGWGWGLLPFQSSHSLSLLVWFIFATLGGVAVFIKFYGNGIILESISAGISEVRPQVRRFAGDVGRFTKTTTKRKSYKKRKKRR